MRKVLTWLLVLVLLVAPAAAAVTPNSAVTVQTPRAYKVQLTNASGTTAATLAAGGANGTKVTGVWATSTDTAANSVVISVLRSAVSYVQVTVALPANSGNAAGSPPVNLLTSGPSGVWPGLPVDSDGNPYLILESTDTLQVAVASTITSGKLVNVSTVAGDF